MPDPQQQQTQAPPQDDAAMISSFASKVRTKFPGAYDDMGDAELAQKIVTKHPQYSDMLPKSIQPGAVQQKPGGPILNANTLPPKPEQSAGNATRMGVGNFLKDYGVDPNNESMLGVAGDLGTGLAKSAWQSIKRTGPLFPVDMLASGIEGAATNLEKGGRGAYQAIKPAFSGGSVDKNALGASLGDLGAGATQAFLLRGAEEPTASLQEGIANPKAMLGAAGDTLGKLVRDPATNRIRPIREIALDAVTPDNPDAIMEQRAQDLMRRGVQQSKLDTQAARANKGLFNLGGPSTTATNSATLGNQSLSELGNATPFQPPVAGQSTSTSSLGTVPKLGPPEESRIVAPGSKAPDLKTTYQSYKGPQLQALMDKGDVEAMREFIRNPRPGAHLPDNARFLLEEAERTPWRNRN